MNSDTYCRLCGCSSECFFEIFDENGHDISISFKIHVLLSISILKIDALSHYICSICNDKLEEFYLFSKKCQQTQIRLFNEERIKKTLSIWKMEDYDDSDNHPTFTEDNKIEKKEESENSTENGIMILSSKTVPTAETVSVLPTNDLLNTETCTLPEVVDIVETNTSVLTVNTLSKTEIWNPSIKSSNVKKSSDVSKLCYSKLAKFLSSRIKVNPAVENLKYLKKSSHVNALKNLKSPEGAPTIRPRDLLSASTKYSSAKTRENAKLTEKIFILRSRKLAESVKNGMYRTKKDENSIKCPYCGENFTRKEFELEHMGLHTEDPELQKKILEHVALPPVIKQFECETCKIPFNRELSYLEHMNKHANLCPVKCHLCDRKFFGHKKTRAHVRAHLIGTYKCDSCNYAAKTSQDLQKHQRGVHSDERIMCNICGKLFSAFHHNMKKHLETHNDTRPFKCDVCDASFKTRAGLSRHRENLHFPVSVMCSLCGTICGSKQKYKKHYYKCRRKNKKSDFEDFS